MNVSNFAEGQDIIDAADMAQTMGFHPYEISSDLGKAAKFADIVDYMKNFENKNFLLTKLVSRVDKDNAIDHVWKYVSLHKMMGAKTKMVSGMRLKRAKYLRRLTTARN